MQNVGIKLTATDEASGVFSRVSQEAGKLGSSVSAVGGSFTALASTAIAGLSVISLASQVKEAIDLADSFNKLSQKTGIAVEDLSRLKYAANLADVSTEGLANGIKKLNVNISAAANGNKEQAAFFKALGINVRDAAGNVQKADKVFVELADRFAGSADGANKVTVAVGALGKTGEILIPLLNAGAAGLKDMGDEAKKLGVVMGSEFAKNAEEFNDNLAKLRAAGQGVFVTFGTDVVKGLGEAAKAMADAAIEGGKLAGIYAGLKTLIWGTEEHKRNKAFFEDTEAMMRLENRRLELKREGFTEDSRTIKNLDLQLAGIKENLRIGQQYRKLLDDTTKKEADNRKPLPTFDSNEIKNAAKALGAGGAAAPAVINPYEALNKSIRERIALVDAELTAKRPLTEAEKQEVKALSDLEAIRSKLTQQQRDANVANLAAVKISLDIARAKDEELAIEKSLAREAAERAELMRKFRESERNWISTNQLEELEARNASVKALRDGNTALKEEIAVIGLNEQALADHEMALLADTIAEKENEASRLEAIGTGKDRAEQLRIEVALLKERRTLTGQKGAANAAAEAARQQAEETKRTGEQIENLLTESIMRGFENGKGFAENFRDTVANMFKTLVLRPVISAVVSPVAQGLTGALGFSGAANAATTGASLFSGGSSLSNAANLAGFGSGSSIFSQFAGSSVGTSLGLSTTVDAIGGLGTASTALTGAGSAFAAAMPWVGGALLLSSLFGGNGFKSSASTGDSLLSADALGNVTGLTNGQGGRPRTASSDSMVQDLRDTYLKTAASLGIGTRATEFRYAGNTGAQGENPQFALSGGVFGVGGFNQGETALSDDAVKLAASRAIFATLQNSDLPKYLKGAFDDITASTASSELISATLASAQAFKSLHDQMLALPFTQLQDLSYGAAKGLTDASGGIESFKANLGTLYDNFYTADEKTAQLATTTAKAFQDLGVVMPDLNTKTRDWYRSELERLGALDLGIEANARAYAGMLSLGSAVNTLATTADNVQRLVSGVRENVQSSIFNLQYGQEDNAGKYRMLDVKGATIDSQLRSSTDITAIAKLANEEISLLNQAFALLDPSQQKSQTVQFEEKLNSIDAFVTQMGADPLGLARAQAKETADIIAAAVEVAVAKAMASSGAQIAAAATSIQAAADTPSVIQIIATTSPGVEVAISDYSSGGRG